MGNQTYLSACAIYRDEAPYLREWIEFHGLVGVQRFFLYDDGSTDHHDEVLAPYIEDGTVVRHDSAVLDVGGEHLVVVVSAAVVIEEEPLDADEPVELDPLPEVRCLVAIDRAG